MEVPKKKGKKKPNTKGKITYSSGPKTITVNIVVVGEAGTGKTQLVSTLGDATKNVSTIINPTSPNMGDTTIESSLPPKAGLSRGTTLTSLTKVAYHVGNNLYALNLLDTKGLLDLDNSSSLSIIEETIKKKIGGELNYIFVLIQNGRLRVDSRAAYVRLLGLLSPTAHERVHFMITHCEGRTESAKEALLKECNDYVFDALFATYPTLSSKRVHLIGCHDDSQIVDELQVLNQVWKEEVIQVVLGIVSESSYSRQPISSGDAFKSCSLF